MDGIRSGSNMSDVRGVNRSIVFEAIRNLGPISRSEIAVMTKLTPTTITKIVNELLRERLIMESGKEGNPGPGRNRILLRLNPKAAYVVGVGFDRTGITTAVTDLDAHVVSGPEVRISAGREVVSPLDLMASIRNAIHLSKVDRQKIIGIGVAAPGPLDVARGIIESPPNLKGWTGVKLREMVEDEFGVPMYLENDANACALAERWFGCATNVSNFVYIRTTSGIGGGVFIGGELYRGETGGAGEIGHITIDINGPRCECGNRGCVELYASTSLIMRRVINAIQGGQTTRIADFLDTHSESGGLSLEMIGKAAREGDEFAKQVISEVAGALGVAAVNAVNLFNPELVVFGGELSDAWDDLLIRPIAEIVRDRGWGDSARIVRVVRGALGKEALIIGAATMAIRELVRRPTLGVSRALVAGR
ncbi:MAG: ROK family transcriptional regulator [Firmicutes bacterium]|nr:ROK family transcriptional regulator [Bacillota bacterium]